MASIKGGQKALGALQNLARALTSASTVKIGFLANATYPDGKKVAMIAAIQEYGAPSRNIPPRPFFRHMIAAKKAEWGPAIAGLLKDNGYDAFQTLLETGEAVSGQLRKSIIDTNSPALSPVTLARRGYTGKAYNPKDPSTFGAKPLVDTGHMLNSVDYEVKA
jgi:hypothetical protein